MRGQALFYEKQIVLDSTVHKQVLVLVTPKQKTDEESIS